MTVGGAMIGWRSCKQFRIVLSSTEAEDVSASDLAREIVCMRRLMSELGYEQSSSNILSQENSGVKQWAEGDGNFRRTKHVQIRYHHIRQLVQNGTIHVEYTPTNKMNADMLGEPLYGTKLAEGSALMGLNTTE
jgi:hypothetical protein